MKRLALLISLLTLTFTLTISLPGLAGYRTIYRTDQPMTINTSLNMQTVMFFETEVEHISSNTEMFRIELDKKADKIVITPLQPGAYTNMIVVCRNTERFFFRLVEKGKDNFDDAVDIKATRKTTVEELVNICNHRAAELDPILKNTTQIYDVRNCFTLIHKPLARLYLKRVVTSSSLKKTVLWLRLENLQSDRNSQVTLETIDAENKSRRGSRSKGSHQIVKKETEIRLLLDKITLGKRRVNKVVIESEKDVLAAREFTDFYLIVDGAHIDKSYLLGLNLNGKQVMVRIKNIPYQKQEFRVYQSGGSGSYQTIDVDNYRR